MMQLSDQKIEALTSCSLHYTHEQEFIEDIQCRLKEIGEKTYPIVEAVFAGGEPGWISVFVLSKNNLRMDPEDFVKKMFSRWLIPGKSLRVSFQRHLDFSFTARPKDVYFALQMMIKLEEAQDRSRAEQNLHSLIEEVKRGIGSTSLAYQIMHTKGLPNDEKDSFILEEMAAILQKRPHEVDADIISDIRQALFQCPVAFKPIRSVDHLSRLFFTHYIFKKSLLRHIGISPHKRHVLLKVLRTKLVFPFGTKTVLGLVIGINLLKDREVLEEMHIIAAVHNILPDCLLIKGSFLSQQGVIGPIRSLYIEIEHRVQKSFSYQEIQLLRKKLPFELKQHIEHLMPMTFMRRNEEEVFRNIIALREQLKSTRDLPQVVISFEEQTHHDLFFTVVLLRVVTKFAKSLEILFHESDAGMRFIPDRVELVGKLRGRYQKEANIFRLQLAKDDYLRKDRSVDLYKARQDIGKALEKAFGKIRDYNGGLILKQDERLKDFIEGFEGQDPFLMENFFYSITPIAMQGIMSAQMLKAFYNLFTEVLEVSEVGEYVMRFSVQRGGLFMMFRSENTGLKEVFLEKILALGIPSTELAAMAVNHHGMLCLGYAYLTADDQEKDHFFKEMTDVANQWAGKMQHHQHLRLNLGCKLSTLDPRITRTDNTHIIVKMLYEGLTRMGPDKKPELAIAKEVRVSEDLLTYTFTLRDSYWTDGSPITAYDFLYSWQKVLETEHQSIYSYTLHVIKNAKKAGKKMISFDEVGIKAVDDKTLIVELEFPVPYFLELTSHWTYLLINSRIDKEHPGWAYHDGDTYISNGPFQLKEWKHHQEIVLVKNPYYWDAAQVKLEKITISMVDNPYTELKMFSSGEIDMTSSLVNGLPFAQLQKSVDPSEIISLPLAGVFAFWFNTRVYPFNNKKLRQALSLSIDRQELQGEGIAAYSILPKGFTMLDAPVLPFGNQEVARLLFEEALAELGVTKLPPIKIEYATERRQAGALCVQRIWKETFGLDVIIQDRDWGQLYRSMQRGEHQVVGMAWYSWFWDPHYILDCFSDKGNQHNASGWESSHFSNLLNKSYTLSDPLERREVLKQAENVLVEEMPVIPLYQCSHLYLKKEWMKGVQTSELFDIDFKSAYISRS
ncbi:MAG: peptide ABC transporter substrate-binding protein [Simkaniaceae bacterium]|nr:peptide ABC transporter substrate-binding protein [Simkaniaceae bacterium]